MPRLNTPPATEAIAQTRVDSGAAPSRAARRYPAENLRYSIGPGVERARSLAPYERTAGDPVYRPLRVFTVDPTVSVVEGATAIVNVPYEPVGPGPSGSVLEVLGLDGDAPIARVNLNDEKVTLGSGLPASTTNHYFHQQMVYAVASSVYAAFQLALGRSVAWAFDGKLQLRPHVPQTRNAFYSAATRSLNFGYYQAAENSRLGIPPKSYVFTCLSHDVIVHEFTHALVDGLRTQFMLPTGPDVLGFHEGFADLVAILQRFTYPDVLRRQIQSSRGALERADLLTGIAREFGFTAAGGDRPLRTAIDSKDAPHLYDPGADRYSIGSALVSAVFEAFTVIYRRRTERYVRLATAGTGVLPQGALHPDLVAVLAGEAAKTAAHILTMCIRALDYCPPLDLRLGEYLRALITADHDLVPDDQWAYREALINAFARRKIYPEDVPNLSEDALLWRAPRRPLPPIDALRFAELRFAGDPSSAADCGELRRQACELGEFMTRPDLAPVFGLAPPGNTLPSGTVDLPRVESVRTSRRVGPAGQVIFDLIAEVTQRRTVRIPDTGLTTDFYGGVTVIIDPKGQVRYTVLKRIDQEERLQRQIAFQKQSNLWQERAGSLVAARDLFRLMHDDV